MKEKTKELIQLTSILIFILIALFAFTYTMTFCIINKINWYFIVLIAAIVVPIIYIFLKCWIEGLKGYIKRYKK
jgi:hypothetical protein